MIQIRSTVCIGVSHPISVISEEVAVVVQNINNNRSPVTAAVTEEQKGNGG
jgi:hypothetical protein